MRDKKAKFVELANRRVNKAIEQLRLVGNLSNRSSYEYSDEDVRKIVRALQKEVESLKGRFVEPGGVSDLVQTFRRSWTGSPFNGDRS